MLAPGLRQRFQLDVGRFAADAFEIILNRPHFGQIQKQVLLFAQTDKTFFIQLTNRNMHQIHLVWLDMRAWRFGITAINHFFDTVVGQNAAADGLHVLLRHRPQQDILASRANTGDRIGPHIFQRRLNGFGRRVGHAAFEVDFNLRCLHGS